MDELILGKWEATFIEPGNNKKAEGKASIEFLDSTVIIDGRLTRKYSMKNDTLFIDGMEDSKITTLDKKTLEIRPLKFEEYRVEISLIHAITFKKVEK